MSSIRQKNLFRKLIFLIAALFLQPSFAKNLAIAVGPQYSSTHIYVAPQDLDAFVNSIIATFGGQASKVIVSNVLPVPSNSQFRGITTPVGNFGVFAYLTPIPFPFGQERYGYLVSDMDQAIKLAIAVGADVIVEPFKDPIGRDAVIQLNGVKIQLYWHVTAPSSAPLKSIPENRIYLSRNGADEFVRKFLLFSNGKVVEDDKQANASEIGRPNDTFRKIRIESKFGKLLIMVTDGHLPYPFGYDITGYEVEDLNATLSKAKTAGATILSEPYNMKDRSTAIVKFPGGYIAEVHALKTH